MRAAGWSFIAAGAVAVGIGWMFAAATGEMWVVYPLLGGFALIAIGAYFVGTLARYLPKAGHEQEQVSELVAGLPHLAIVTPIRPDDERPATSAKIWSRPAAVVGSAGH